MILWWLLTRRNIECALLFGARKENAHFEAHAWVECCGVPLNEAADVHQRFASFETAPANNLSGVKGINQFMSGIVGIVNLDGAPVEQDLLWRMTEHMSYRGPDAQEIWIHRHVGFGHTMLRTTFESETEKQPLSLDGEGWLTADARIDGCADLIHELESKTRSNLKGVNDAELILHAQAELVFQ